MTAAERKCAWCGAPFTPTEDQTQAYCKKTHASKASAARKRLRDALSNAGRCPTPNKRVWINDPGAVNWHLPTNQFLYHCSCGGIHAASNSKANANWAARLDYDSTTTDKEDMQ